MHRNVRAALLTIIAVIVLAAASPAGAATTTTTATIPHTDYLSGVACASATSCEAVGTSSMRGVAVAITNGVAGAAQVIPGTIELRGVACPTAANCVAVGDTFISEPAGSDSSGLRGVVLFITNGIPGPAQVVPGTGLLESVDCPSASTCEAVGRAVFPAFSQGFPHFTPGVVVPITNGIPGAPQTVESVGFDNVACPSLSTCEGVGSNSNLQGVAVSITNGTASAPQVVPGTYHLFGVACASATNCQAVGENNGMDAGVVVPITNGSPGTVLGTSDGPLPFPGGCSGPTTCNQLFGVSCASVTACQAVGVAENTNLSGITHAVVLPITAGTPGAAQIVPGAAFLGSVSCASPPFCLAVGRDAVQNGVLVTIVTNPDSTPPTCQVTATRRTNPAQQDVAVQDADSGLRSITNVQITNGTVNVPPITAGTTGPVVVTATKTDQTQRTVWSFDATDAAGNLTHCA